LDEEAAPALQQVSTLPPTQTSS